MKNEIGVSSRGGTSKRGVGGGVVGLLGLVPPFFDVFRGTEKQGGAKKTISIRMTLARGGKSTLRKLLPSQSWPTGAVKLEKI